MLFLLDTCFCMHSRELFDSRIFDIRPILKKLLLGTTSAIKEELPNYQLDQFLHDFDWHIIDISPSESQKIPTYLHKLDVPDQSLWAAAHHYQKEEYAILTDDGELLMECQIASIRALRLPSFLLLMVREGLLKKNNVSKCFRFWHNCTHFKKKDLCRWKQELDSIV